MAALPTAGRDDVLVTVSHPSLLADPPGIAALLGDVLVALPKPEDLIFPALLVLVAVVVFVTARALAPGRRMTFLREVEIVLAAYFTYFAVRGATEGAASTAVANAHRIEDFEKAFGIFIEPDLQDTIVDHSLLVDAANLVYIWGHWPVISVVALWLFTRRQPTYLLFRNAFLISGAIGLVWFWLFPVAPPRLAELGLVDTVVERSNFYRVLQPPQLTNQFAAFPSLHFGWNLLMGLALYWYTTNRAVRAFGLLLPAAMFVAIVLTANHYIIDGVAGGAIALFGLWAAVWLQRRRDRRSDAAEARAGTVATGPPLASASSARGERPRRA